MENTWSKDTNLEKVFLAIKSKNLPPEGGIFVFGSFFLPRRQVVMSPFLSTSCKELIFLFSLLFIFLPSEVQISNIILEGIIESSSSVIYVRHRYKKHGFYLF